MARADKNDDFDFDFDDDAPKHSAHHVPHDRAARVIFVVPQPEAPGELFVEAPDGHRLDLLGSEARQHMTALAEAYISIRSIFSDDIRDALDRVGDDNFPTPPVQARGR